MTGTHRSAPATRAPSGALRTHDKRPHRRRRRPAGARRVARPSRMGCARQRRGGVVTTAHLGRVRATAFAKLTLSLRVLGPRREDGFHELEALTVPIGQPHDTLEALAVPYPPGLTFDV